MPAAGSMWKPHFWDENLWAAHFWADAEPAGPVFTPPVRAILGVTSRAARMSVVSRRPMLAFTARGASMVVSDGIHGLTPDEEDMQIITKRVFTDFEVTSDQYVDIPQLEIDVEAGKAYSLDIRVPHERPGFVNLFLRCVMSGAGDLWIADIYGGNILGAGDEISTQLGNDERAIYSLSAVLVAGADGTFKVQVRSEDDAPADPSLIEPGACIVAIPLDD